MKRILLLSLFLSLFVAAAAPAQTVKIDASKTGEMISPYIYGQFIEHLGRCINGDGIWAEMLEDRKFFHAVDAKESPWKTFGIDVKVVMDMENPFAGQHSPKIVLDGKIGTASIMQKKWMLQKDRKYVGYIWLKCSDQIADVRIMLDAFHGSAVGLFKAVKIPVKQGDYYRHDFEFTGPFDAPGQLTITADRKGDASAEVHIGCVSLMPADNVHGMRKDTLELLKRLDSPVYRWPGGNFVSGYDWKDGIGDRDRRPPRKNPAWKGVEPNDFGMNEFLKFCEILETQPYIAVNTGNGDVKSAVEELQYVNGDASTPMGKLRAEHGYEKPYDVVWWGIGNEMYGDWQIGHMPVEDYIKKNNEFVDAFRKEDPRVLVIAVGAVGKWDEAFLPGAAEHMDLISEHFYVQKKDDVREHVRQIPDSIKRIADAHRKYRKELPNFKDLKYPVPIALDEWNYWYGEHVFGELGTRYFVKDGLGVAAGIHEFARQSDMYLMANYAQTVNVIGCIKTSKTNAKMETTGLALELYRKHFGNVPVETVVEDAQLDVQAALIAEGIEANRKGISFGLGWMSDKEKEEGKKPFEVDLSIPFKEKPFGVTALSVGIVNTSSESKTLRLDIDGFDLAGKKISAWEIADPENDPQGFNDPDEPYRIEIKEIAGPIDADAVTVKPYSITLLKIEEPDKEEKVSGGLRSLRKRNVSGPFRSGFPRMTRPGRF